MTREVGRRRECCGTGEEYLCLFVVVVVVVVVMS
jgi:hypothetical protein